MTKIFCDRCGREIVNNKDRFIVKVEGIKYSLDNNCFELCFDCRSKLNEFAKGVEK